MEESLYDIRGEEVKELKRELRVTENTLQNKQEEINDLKDKLRTSETDLFMSNSERKGALDKMKLKDDEIRKLKETITIKVFIISIFIMRCSF